MSELRVLIVAIANERPGEARKKEEDLPIVLDNAACKVDLL